MLQRSQGTGCCGSGIAHGSTHSSTSLRHGIVVLVHLGIKSGIHIIPTHGHGGLARKSKILRRTSSLRFGYHTGTVRHHRIISGATGSHHQGGTSYKTKFYLHADTENITNDKKKQGQLLPILQQTKEQSQRS